MHTLLDLRGNIPSFIHISDGKLHDVHALDMPLAGSRSHLRRGSWLRRLCPPLCVAPSRGLLRHACQVEHRCSSRLFGADGSLDRHHLRPDHLPGRLLHPSGLPRTSAGASAFKDPESAKTLVFITNNFSLPAATICALYKSRWQVELFFKWIKQHLRIKQFYGTSENAVKTQIWIAVSVYVPRRHRQEAPRPGRLALHFVTDPLGDPLRENDHTSSTCGRRKQMQLLRK